MSANKPPVRVLLGMLGTDVHSKGIRTLALLLRDAGFEVIYLGEHNSPQGMAKAASMEDVDVVGVSFSSGAYVHYTQLLAEAMRNDGLEDIALMVGGLVHPDDHGALRLAGVTGIFGPGSDIKEVTAFLNSVRAS